MSSQKPNSNREQAEQALRESESRLRDITFSMADWVWEVDVNGVYTYSSQKSAKLLGYSAEEILGKTPFDFMPPDEAERIGAIFSEIAAKKAPINGLENWSIQKNGGRVCLLTNGVPILDAKGNLQGYRGVGQDITERKQTENALRANEEKYRTYIDQSPEGIFITDEAGKYIDVNTTACSMLGYTREELLSLSIRDLNDSTESAAVSPQFFTLKEHGRIKSEMMLRKKNGGVIPVNVDAIRLSNNTFMAFCTDITERKQVEGALKESENFLRETQIIAELGTYTMDIASGIWKSSEILDAIFGIDRDYDKTVEGWGAIIHPEWRQRMMDYFLQDVIGKKARFDKEYKIVRQDTNAERWVSGVGELKFDGNGQPITMIGTIKDITPRKQSEENLRRLELQVRQSEKMEAIGQLAGGIAHDFNNVLGGIIGYTDISLSYAEHGSMLEKNLLKVLQASDRAKNLVKQILAFSRQSNSQKSVTSLGPIIVEVLDLLKSSIPSSVIIDSDLHNEMKSVLADTTQIHQAVLNLATNAVHAMNRKGTLTIRLYPVVLGSGHHCQSGELPPGDYAAIEIADTGCGMDAVTLSKAFEPFFTTKPVGEGTGMGLSVVLGIVQLHGGDLQVESEVGKGTAVRIYLPTTGAPVTQKATNEILSLLSGTERVLFVDDEKMLVEMSLEWLTTLGYTVTAFSDSLDALTMIRERSADIDILVTDQTMPGLTGIELVKQALSIKKDLPVILCTGFSNEVNQESADALGVSKFIMKPYRNVDISKAIRDVLDHNDAA